MNDRATIGLRDKLYWRKGQDGRYHCFKKLSLDAAQLHGGNYREPRWGSLCTRHLLTRSGGQRTDRPPAHQRCGRCDGLEMERRGWSESGPTTTTEG